MIYSSSKLSILTHLTFHLISFSLPHSHNMSTSRSLLIHMLPQPPFDCPLRELINTIPQLTDVWIAFIPSYLYFPCNHCQKVSPSGFAYCCDHCNNYRHLHYESGCDRCTYDHKEGWRSKKRKLFASHKRKVLIDVSEEKKEESGKRTKTCDDEKCNRC